MIAELDAFLASETIRAALPPTLLIATVTSGISVMVLAHRLSFLTVGVSHALLAGVGVAVTFALPLLPTAAASGVLVALLLTPSKGREGLDEDAGTGMLFAGAMALGIVLISAANRYDVDLFGLLFGNILTIAEEDLRALYWLGGTILAGLMFAARAWWLIAFDDTAAAATGLPVALYRMLLYSVVALTVVLCVKLAGAVLTTGLLVLPAACAWFWGRSLRALWLLSLLFSLVGSLVGLFVSYMQDWPSGATVVLALCLIFILSWGVSWLTQSVRKRALPAASPASSDSATT